MGHFLKFFKVRFFFIVMVDAAWRTKAGFKVYPSGSGAAFFGKRKCSFFFRVSWVMADAACRAKAG